jgi:hypothetical protein
MKIRAKIADGMQIGGKVRITKGLLKDCEGEITNHGEGWSPEDGYYVLYAVQVGGRKGTMFEMIESQLEVIV